MLKITKFLVLLVVFGVTAFALEIREGDVLKLERLFNLRANPHFRGKANLMGSLPAGSEVLVTSVKHFSSVAYGNYYALQVNINGRLSWIYYDADAKADPGMELRCNSKDDIRCKGNPHARYVGAPQKNLAVAALRDQPTLPQAVVERQVSDHFLNFIGSDQIAIASSPLIDIKIPSVDLPDEEAPSTPELTPKAAEAVNEVVVAPLAKIDAVIAVTPALEPKAAPVVAPATAVTATDAVSLNTAIEQYRVQLQGKQPERDVGTTNLRYTRYPRDGRKIANNPMTQEDCGGAEDLRKEPRGQQVLAGPAHVRSQGDMGLCTAYADADLVSWYTGTFASAQDISMNMFAVNGTPFSQKAFSANPILSKPGQKVDSSGWLISKPLENIERAGGICPESVMPSNDYGFSADMLQSYEWARLNDNYNNGIGQHRKAAENLYNNYRAGASLATPELCSAIQGVKEMVPGMDLAQIAVALENAATVDQFEDWLKNLQCRGRRSALPKGRLTEMDTSDSSTGLSPTTLSQRMAAIVNQLDNKNMLRVNLDLSAYASDMPPGTPRTGPHAMTIIGKRWQNNKCEFLVRTSWGAGEDACKTNFKPGIECDPVDGTIWLPDTAVAPALTQVYYLEKD